MTRCKLQAKKCKFRDNTDIEERLIEQLIIGTRHRKVQEKLLGKDGDLKLDDALDIARTCEYGAYGTATRGKNSQCY